MGLDWIGMEPDYIRVGVLVPCNYKKCTSGIVHKKRPRVILVCKYNTRVRTDECTEKRVNLNMGGDVCKMCYRNQDISLTVAQKKKLCNTARLGCPSCKEIVCAACWKVGYDLHKTS